MAQKQSWEQAEKILCVRLDTLGDVLMTTPALRAVKESLSCSRLTLLTSSAGAGIARLIPQIDRVLTYDAPWLKATRPQPDSAPEYAMAEHLRQLDFDAAIIFTARTRCRPPFCVIWPIFPYGWPTATKIPTSC